MKVAALLWLAAVLCGIPAASLAQSEAPAAQASVEDMQRRVNAQRVSIKTLQEENLRLRTVLEGNEAPLWPLYLEQRKREYAFQTQMMDVAVRSFWHQTISSYAIGVVVLAIVLAGVYFAYIQLQAGLTSALTAIKSAGPPPDVAALQNIAGASPPVAVAGPVLLGEMKLDASLEKVTLSTSIVGIVVLAISFAFLYLYTQEIYAIKYIPLRTTGENSLSSGAEPARPAPQGGQSGAATTGRPTP